MDNKEYGKILGNYILERVLYNISRDMSLKRKSKYGYFTRVSPEVRYKECEINKYLKHHSYNNVILKFKSILDNELSHCNNNGFYKNIKRLYIKEYKIEEEAIEEFEKKPDSTANYDALENEISIFRFNTPKIDNYNEDLLKEDISTHELLHMSTTYKKGIIALCGFHQAVGGKHHIGVGLNEGYTELLNERYFSNAYPTVSYINQKHIALGIEEIVGQEKMEKLYFDANLAGLVDELCQYISKEETLSLLREIDECHLNEKRNSAEYYKKTIELRQKIAKIQNVKNNKLLAEGKISQEEYEYNELKSNFYAKGYILNKNPDNYSFRYNDNYKETTLSPDAYRILKNVIDYGNKQDDFIICAYKLNKNVLNLDLSKVERIELTSDNEIGYNVILRQSHNSNDNELDNMLINSKNEKTTNHKK